MGNIFKLGISVLGIVIITLLLTLLLPGRIFQCAVAAFLSVAAAYFLAGFEELIVLFTDIERGKYFDED